MYIEFIFKEDSYLVHISKCPADFNQYDVEDALTSYLEQCDEDTSYSDIVDDVMSSFSGVQYRIVNPYKLYVD